MTLGICTAPPNALAGLVLNANFVDGAGQSWDAIRRGVVNQAVSDWQITIAGVNNGMGGVDSVSISFNVTFTNAGNAGYLGYWSASGKSLDIY